MGKYGSLLGNKNACGKRTKEFCEVMSTINVGNKNASGERTPEQCKRIRVTTKLAMSSPKIRKTISRGNLRRWKDLEYAEKVTKGWRTSPNKTEKSLYQILNVIAHKEFKYNGNFNLGVLLDGLIPDFVDVNGQKKVIDLHGEYWHKGEPPMKRAKRYAKCGYKSLIVWDFELEDIEKLQNKLIRFTEV